MSNFCTITACREGLQIASNYHPDFVAALKREIPSSFRKFDGTNKIWVISPRYGRLVTELASQHLGVAVRVPQINYNLSTITKIFDLEYLGQVKERDGENSAFGYENGGWNVVFSENVLKNWFCVDEQYPNEASNLYAVLGVSKHASDAEVKTAFRRMARQWHPDVCKEPGAVEQFLKIKQAYETVGDPQQRQKYDIGLQFASMTEQKKEVIDIWKPPLRCGRIEAEGTQEVGRFIVSKIIRWDDIVINGLTYTSFWKYGDDMFTRRWI